MDIQELKKLTKNKSKAFPVRLNPKLLELFDKALGQSQEYSSRNDFIESAIIEYLKSKKML
jgi:metal-responsive CopG/Arc/MetJ family transcriptional regulator